MNSTNLAKLKRKCQMCKWCYSLIAQGTEPTKFTFSVVFYRKCENIMISSLPFICIFLKFF